MGTRVPVRSLVARAAESEAAIPEATRIAEAVRASDGPKSCRIADALRTAPTRGAKVARAGAGRRGVTRPTRRPRRSRRSRLVARRGTARAVPAPEPTEVVAGTGVRKAVVRASGSVVKRKLALSAAAKAKKGIRHSVSAKSAIEQGNDAVSGAEDGLKRLIGAVTEAVAFAAKVIAAVAPGALTTVAVFVFGALVVLSLFMPALLVPLVASREATPSGANEFVRVAQAEYASGEADGTHHYGDPKYWRFMFGSSFVNGSVTPWCASFVSWCANECGLLETGTIPRTGYVPDYYDYYAAHPDKGSIHVGNEGYVPRPGDLMLYGRNHVGIVTEVEEDGSFWTTEGNASNSVARRHHARSGSTYTGTGLTGTPAYVTPTWPQGWGATVTIPATCSGTCPIHGRYEEIGVGTYATREWDLASYDFAGGSTQSRVERLWESSGSVTDELGFNTLDGRYLVACTSVFGEVGDWITFTFDDGTTLECVKVDAKSETVSPWDSHPANEWGHAHGANVLEFCGSGAIGDNPYVALGLDGHRVVGATNHGSVL